MNKAVGVTGGYHGRGYGLVLAVLAMGFAAIMGHFLSPQEVVENTHPKLESQIPPSFVDWRQIQSGSQQVSLFATDENGNDPTQAAYDDSLLRSYDRQDGKTIMLAIAYDRIQREESRVHRPEICYLAQGFRIIYDRDAIFNLPAGGHRRVEGRQMLTVRGTRWEAVSFWIRLGDTFTQNPWRSRIYVITEGLAGRLHDGLLLRTSEIIQGPEAAEASFKRQEVFMDDLASSLTPAGAAEILTRNADVAPRGPT